MSWSAWLSWWTWHSRSLASRHCERVAVRVVCVRLLPSTADHQRDLRPRTRLGECRGLPRLDSWTCLSATRVPPRPGRPKTSRSHRLQVGWPSSTSATRKKAVRLECRSGITITLLTVLRTDSRPIFLPTHSRLAQSRCRSVSRVSPPRGTLPPVLHPLGPGTASRPLRTASVHAMQTIKCVVRPPRLRSGPRRVARPRIRTSGPPPRSASVAPLCRARALSRRIRSRSSNAGLSCTSR